MESAERMITIVGMDSKVMKLSEKERLTVLERVGAVLAGYSNDDFNTSLEKIKKAVKSEIESIL